MGEIEVNEYVRTKDGIIGIFDRYSSRKENSLYKSPFNCFIKIKNRKTPLQCCEEYIVKHSKQLIDLIEDKDILEIEVSEEFVEKKDKKKLIQIGNIYTKETLQKDIDNGIITRILTILSYNQYMANCYKVGEEDE